MDKSDVFEEMYDFEIIGKGKNRFYKVVKFNTCGHVQEILFNNLKISKPICKSCTLERLKQEADLAGLELLELTDSCYYAIYKFKECGHIQKIQRSNVRTGSFSCSSCEEIRFQAEADKAGLDIVRDMPAKNNHRYYKFRNCGHIQEIGISSVRRGSATCTQCFNERIQKEAEDAGLEIIDGERNFGKRLYRFKDCSHIQEIQISKVRDKAFRCKCCVVEKHRKEAEDAGLILLGKTDVHPDYRLYKFKCCGHEQAISTARVRSEEIRCPVCSDSYWNEPSNLYILKITFDNFTWIKIGFAKNISKRVCAYGLPKGCVVDILYSAQYETAFLAKQQESILHDRFKDFRLDPNVMVKYHRNSGQTECFDCSIDLSEVL